MQYDIAHYTVMMRIVCSLQTSTCRHLSSSSQDLHNQPASDTDEKPVWCMVTWPRVQAEPAGHAAVSTMPSQGTEPQHSAATELELYGSWPGSFASSSASRQASQPEPSSLAPSAAAGTGAAGSPVQGPFLQALVSDLVGHNISSRQDLPFQHDQLGHTQIPPDSCHSAHRMGSRLSDALPAEAATAAASSDLAADGHAAPVVGSDSPAAQQPASADRHLEPAECGPPEQCLSASSASSLTAVAAAPAALPCRQHEASESLQRQTRSEDADEVSRQLQRVLTAGLALEALVTAAQDADDGPISPETR